MAIIRAQQGTFYVSGKKCVLCQAPLSHAHRDRRHIICGPGGNYCNHFNNDVHLRSRIGDARFETFRALGVKERWRHRRPRAIASEHCHYVLITGILPDTTGHNLEVIGNCSRLQQALEKISQWYRERPNQQDLALPYSLFHRHGYPEAVVAFEDRGFAELVVAIISRDSGGFYIDDALGRRITTIHARFLDTEEEKVDFFTRYTSERLSASVPLRRKRISFA